MNRDALLATFIGLALGLTITGLLIVGPGLVKYLPKITLPTISLSLLKPAKAPATAPKTFSFAIESPLPEAIETSPDLVVSGTAEPKSVVVVAGLLDEEVVVASADGKYAGKVTLQEGKNVITVTQYQKGKPNSKTVTVYYTQENF